MRKFAWLIAATLTLVAVIFCVQNATTTEYRFLSWTIEIRRSVVVAACIGTGVVVGWLLGATHKHR